jgi:hypothetical protein
MNKAKICEAIIKIKNSGATNMFDLNMVQVIANANGDYELVVFIEEHKKEYVQFILTGEL